LLQLTDDFQKATLLNEYFVSMCVADDSLSHVLNVTLPPCLNPLIDITFSQLSAYKHLQKLKSSLSSGPDNIPPLFFRNLARVLAGAVTKLNRLIFATGKLPDMWRFAFVTPIFQKGCSSDPGNYRPISLTCVASKFFATSIKEQLLKHVSVNNLIVN
jgi:hypothetical protein